VIGLIILLYIYRTDVLIIPAYLEVMEKLEIARKANTPSVLFDPETGNMKIDGRSIPENPGDFYDEVIQWLRDYFKKPKNVTTLDLNLEYVNSGSSKYLLVLFRLMKEEYQKGSKIIINWYYEEDDEDMLEAGEDYESIIRVPFKMIQIVE